MGRQSSWIRYGLARLRPLGRPIFWAPSIAILLLMLFAWEFFSRPELATYLGLSNPDETLSAEDQAIGADIDSLPLLMNDIKIASRSAADPAILPAPTTAESPAPNRLFSASTESATPSPSVQPQSGQGVFGAFTNALTAQLGLPSPQPDPTTPAPLPANRLQEAIDKLAAENRPAIAQTPIEGTIRLDTPINAAPQATNSFSAIVEGAQPIPPGTAPIVSAPLPIVPPVTAPVSAITPQAIEVQPSNFGVIQNPPVVNQQPFTVPRSIPGRAIGGGNFNTFSNP